MIGTDPELSAKIGIASGALTGGAKAAISLGITLETIYYAAIGAAAGFLVTEFLKYLKNRKKKDE